MTARPVGDGDGHDELRGLLLHHHPIMRSEDGPFSGCRCGSVRLGQDVIQHVMTELEPWAERVARERAAEELESAAAVRWADKIRWAEVRLDLRRRAAALAAEAPTEPAPGLERDGDAPIDVALAADDRTVQR